MSQATEQPSVTKVERIVLSQAEAVRFLHPPPPTEKVVGSQVTQLPSSPLSELANTGVTVGAGCKLNYRRAVEAISDVISSDIVQSDSDDGCDWSLPQASAVEKILQIPYLIRRAEGTVCRRRLSDTDVIPDDGCSESASTRYCYGCKIHVDVLSWPDYVQSFYHQVKYKIHLTLLSFC